MPSKNDSFFSRERHTIEVTSSQIVFAICGLIGFAVVCFGLGVYLGNVQDSTATRVARQTTAPAPAPAPAPELKGAGVQTSPLAPRPGTASPSATPPATEAEPVFLPVPEQPGHAPQPDAPPATGPPMPSTEPATPTEGLATPGTDTPPASTTTEASPPAEATVTPEVPETTGPGTGIAVTAESPAPPAPVEATSSPPSPAAPSVTEVPASPAPVAPAPASPSTATATTGQQTAAPFSAPGTFVIQVSASTDEKGAQQFAKKMEAAGQTKTRIVRSGDGKWYRVYVGEYANRQEAESARATLAKMPGLGDCFVKKLD